MAASVSAASAAAEPDPLAPNSAYMADSSERSGGGRGLHQFLEAAVHFLRRHVLDVRADRPHVAERIGQRAGAVAVELVGDRTLTVAPAAIARANAASTSGT